MNILCMIVLFLAGSLFMLRFCHIYLHNLVFAIVFMMHTPLNETYLYD